MKAVWLLLLLMPLGAMAQVPIPCDLQSGAACSPNSNPGNGQQGAPAWQGFGITNENFAYLAPLYSSANGTLFGFFGNQLHAVTLGNNLSLSGGILSASGGGTPGGSNSQIQINNSGLFGGTSALSGNTYSFSNMPKPKFNVMDYAGGAAINACSAGSPDGTSAIQAAVTAAAAVGGDLSMPGGPYCISSTIQAVGPFAIFSMDLQGDSLNQTQIVWSGGSGTSSTPVAMFHSLGWGNSTIKNIQLVIPSTVTNVAGWSIDANSSYGSSAGLIFENDLVSMSGDTNGVGWLMGFSSSGIGNINGLTFIDDLCYSTQTTTGTYCFLSLRQNNLNWTFINGGCLAMANCFSNWRPSAYTSGSENGGAAMYFYGVGGSLGTGDDYQFATGGNYVISGGRWEVGSRFLAIPAGTSTPVNASMTGVWLTGYTGNVNNNIITVIASANLELDNNNIVGVSPQSDYTSAWLNFTTSSAVIASLDAHDNTISSAEPFYSTTLTGGTLQVNLVNNTRANESGGVTGLYKNVLSSPVITGTEQFNPAPSAANTANIAITTNGTNSSSFYIGTGVTSVGSPSGGAACPPAYVTATSSTTYYGGLVSQSRLGDWQYCSGYFNPIYGFLGMNTTVNEPAVFYMLQGGSAGNGLYVQTLTQGSSCSATLTLQPTITGACTTISGDPQNLSVPLLLLDGWGTVALEIDTNLTDMWIGDTPGSEVRIFHATSGGANGVLALGDTTATTSTATLQAASASVAVSNGAVAITGTTTVNGQSATYAEQNLSAFFNAAMTVPSGGIFGFTKVVKASTLDNLVVSAPVLNSCATTITIYECGTSTTCASPTTMASVALSATATATPASSITSASIGAGHYVAFQSTASSCTTVDGQISAQIHSN